MTDLGVMSYFLGIEFIHKNGGLVMHQKSMHRKFLKDIRWKNAT